MRFKTTLFSLFVCAVVMISCGAQPTPAPTVEPARNPAPTSARAASAPLDTPAPTPTRQPLPPTIVSIAPDRGEEQVLAAPVIITFDQPMDEASTSAAFSIEPKVPGEVQVKDNRLIFSPTERLKRGAEYQVMVSATASSAAGLRLPGPVSYKFSTAGFLEVASVQPADQSEGVPVDATLVLAFNRPVVPLDLNPASTAGALAPLVITPTVAGKGEWITTSIYRFTPTGALVASTGYTVTVPAGLTDTMGGQLAEPYTYTFRTADPVVTQWEFSRATLREGSDNARIETPITVTFSMPMDRASTEAAFKLTEAETRTLSAPLPGSFTWSPDGTALGFKPERTLKLGTRYYASVARSAKPAHGQGALRTASGQEFTTAFPPRITRTTPANGDERAAPGGSVRFTFASPLNPASLVSGTVTVLPRPTQVYTNYNAWDTSLSISFPQEPETAYTVTLSGKVADPYGNLLGQDYVLRFKTRAYDPYVQLYSNAYIGTYNAYTATTAAVTYRNVPQINFGLWGVSDTEFIPLAARSYWEKWRNYQPAGNRLLHVWSVSPTVARNKVGVAVTELTTEDGEALPPGIYYLTVNDGSKQTQPTNGAAPGAQRQLVVRTTLNVTLKTWSRGALAWVTDLKSGQPVKDVAVTFTDGDKIEQQGKTDADGVAQVSFAQPRQPWETLLAIARTGDHFGVASSAWTEGISPWNFGVGASGTIEPYNAYVYTDRPIYRPGQTIYWKALFRRDNDAAFAAAAQGGADASLYSLPPTGQPVTVTINDGTGKTLLTQGLLLDGMGTVTGKLTLDRDAALGYYYLSINIPDPTPIKERDGGNFGVNFQVAEYRKPEYEVSAQTDRPEYVQGSQINTTVQANYFFGQPVKGATVRWVLLSSDYSFSLPDAEELKGGPYSFTDWDWYANQTSSRFGGALSQGEGVTDADGRYTFSVPADIVRFSQSQRFTFDITILDTNGQAVSTQAAAVVHKGEFYIGLRPQSYVSTAGQPAAIDVLAVDPQGQRVGEVDVRLIANRVKWYSVKEQAEDGGFYWVSKAEKTPVYTETITTGGDGTAVFRFTPAEPGEYKIEATARDKAGHTISSATYAWVSGKTYVPWRQENNDRIELIADKKSYQVGDTAQLLAASPYQTPVKALLTIERAGIFEHRVIEVKSNSEVIAVPIEPAYAPDVFASLILVKGMDETSPAPSFRMGMAELKVSVADKQMKVVLTPLCGDVPCSGATTPRFGPRDTVAWEVQTLDAAGKPVQAETSLALVDKAILTLADDMAGTMMDRFYRERGLSVTTGATLIVNVDRLVAQLAEGGKGGGGGGGDGGDLTVRRDFPDTAYWNAAVKTGPDGKARVELALPDNLTTWSMDARAITADTQVGQVKAEVIATKDLLVRPVLPRFFVVGDKAEIAAIVHNNTQAEVEVEVKLTASGIKTAAASQSKVTIKAGDTAKVTWPVVVQPDAGEVKVQMSAVAGGAATRASPLQDAIEYTLPVHRYTTPEMVGSSGQVAADDSQLELFRLPPGADPTRAELAVTLEPSLAAGLVGSLGYLEHYPYECTEQTVSRFLPNVVTYLAYKKLGIAMPGPSTSSGRGDMQTVLAQQVGVGLQRLYAGQHVDGGWGWWSKDSSEPTVSAYVVLGMAKAKQAGFTVDASALSRGVRYLRGQLAAPTDLQPWELNRQAFLLYALAEAGAMEPNRAGALYEKREGLSLYAKGYLALALGLTDDAASAARIRTLLADITSKAITSGTATHWEEAWADVRNMNSDTRTTAILIDVLARLDPHPTGNLAPNAVRWLMGARQADHWPTTQESAWAIMGLTDWMAATGELEGDYSWQVLLNNERLGQGEVKPATVSSPTTLRADVARLLADQTNALLIERGAGKGPLYYTVQLQTYQPVEQVAPLNRGVIVSREYRLADCGLPANRDGSQPECPTITEAKVGDVIDVRLSLIAPHALYYLIVEDPLPAGAEAIDTSLRTTSSTAAAPEVQRTAPDAKDGGRDWRWSGWWTPTQVELRDEKAALFATWLEPGSYEFRYQIRASLPGEFLTLPPTAYQMYHPEVWGRGAGGMFKIGE